MSDFIGLAHLQFHNPLPYVPGVNLTGGDMSYLIHEGAKVKCELSEISSVRQKRVWQTRLGSKTVPNYLAQIVYIGGGRWVNKWSSLHS